METTTSTHTLRKLTATEGHYIIAINTNKDICPHFATTVYLGSNDSPDNYREITAEERADIEAQYADTHPSPDIEDVIPIESKEGAQK